MFIARAWLTLLAAFSFVVTAPACARRIAADQSILGIDDQADRCRAAIEILNTGRSELFERANYPEGIREAWAHSAVSRCGVEGERAVAAAMRRKSRSNDVAMLGDLTLATKTLRGATMLRTALDLAQDPAASVEARVFALRTLTWLVDPGLSISYENYAVPGNACAAALGPAPPSTTEVPSDARAQITPVAKRLLEDPATQPAVRHASGCTWSFVTRSGAP